MKSAHIIYPHQLFKKEYLPQDITTLFLVEDPLYFGTDAKYPVYFHRQKLMLHRASMRRYIEEVLWPAGYDVEYVEFKDIVDSGDIVQRLRGFDSATVFDVVDDVLQRRLQTASSSVPEAPQLQFLDTPNFYLKKQEVADYFGKTQKTQFSNFYQWQRERWNILIDDNYKPVGGKWSFDADNRKRLPKNHLLPTFEVYGSNKYVEEARHYVQKNFPDNPGSDVDFCWATNHEEAEAWLAEFIEQRLADFGPYEDAIDGQAPWVYHSALTPALNIGLLQPQDIVNAALALHEKKPLPLESLEGFVRQVLGWREYVRGIYQTRHVSMRTSNVFAHKRQLTPDWYDGTTGLPPVDDAIKKVQQRAYLHHIERLMIVGNAMFVSEIDPREVYQWFMEMTIDAYDWVMVPNVCGMSQFADGGSMVTKPYMSGSNYILKMSWYEKDVWCDIWDGLYWGFVEKHRTLLSRNPRMKVIVSQLDHMNEDRRRIIGYRANDFLNAKTKMIE
jgi:deoxyribodipyrimidine photolyase-related protein